MQRQVLTRRHKEKDSGAAAAAESAEDAEAPDAEDIDDEGSKCVALPAFLIKLEKHK